MSAPMASAKSSATFAVMPLAEKCKSVNFVYRLCCINYIIFVFKE